MWKFHDFIVTQILREINFEDCSSAKSAIFAILGAVNFENLVNFCLQKSAAIYKSQNSEPLNVLKMAYFALVESPKLNSRKI